MLTLEDAANLVSSGQTIVTAGFVGIAFPELLAVGLEQRFLQEGAPSDLTLMYGAGQGDGHCVASITLPIREWSSGDWWSLGTRSLYG
ncbi:MAG: hypothetical protein R3C11_07390 [Planctomycetaceae bacterium]